MIKKYARQICAAVSLCCLFAFVPFSVLPMSADAVDMDWHDYIQSVEVLESGDRSAVTLSLPVSNSMYWIYDGSDTLLNSTTGDSITQYLQASSYYFDPEYPYDIVIRPCKDDYFMLSNVPAGTEVYYDWRIKYNGSVSGSELYPATGYGVGNIYYYDSRYSLLYTDSMTISGGPIPTNTLQFLANSTLRNFSSGSTDGNITDAAFMKVSFEVPDFSVTQSGNYTISLSTYRMTILIGSLFDGSGDYTLLINAINESLEAQGKKIDVLTGEIQSLQNQVDDLLTGGEAGEELEAGGDKLESAGNDLDNGVGEIHGFEQMMQGQIENNLGTILASADISGIAPPLHFISTYLSKIAAAIPDAYLVVFTLPFVLGIFLYLVGHPLRVPRPDTSGDEVTRETFQTTEILTGPRSGSVTTTRTVSTSREIGRKSSE